MARDGTQLTRLKCLYARQACAHQGNFLCYYPLLNPAIGDVPLGLFNS